LIGHFEPDSSVKLRRIERSFWGGSVSGTSFKCYREYARIGNALKSEHQQMDESTIKVVIHQSPIGKAIMYLLKKVIKVIDTEFLV